jgi:tetratricopeptide (TPR) repeat protein
MKNLGVRFSNLGQHAQAVKASEEAVAIYRGLAETQPDAFLADLAGSLNDLGIGLSNLGRREEGLKASGEALAIHARQLESRGTASPQGAGAADVFISYARSDREWAFWIASELEALGYTSHIAEWEIKGGDDIYSWMETRLGTTDYVLCVVSDDYLREPYSTLERNAGLWQAASRRPGFVLFVVVKPCRLPTLGDHTRRCDLFGVPEGTARIRFREFMTRRDAPESSAFPGKVIAVSNIPIHMPTHFVAGEDVLATIETALRRDEGRVAITALHGLRGVGKTTLAVAFAERHRADYRVTWWIRAQTDPTMRADLVALGVRLGWVGADDKEEPALAAVMERLRHEGEGILLIFDNALDPDVLRPYLPRGGTTRVLVTSNASGWRGAATPVEIRFWPKQIGADYLIARTGRDGERLAAEALSEALGGLPLAHEQAAAYCERLEVSIADYLRRFEAAPARMLDDQRSAPAEYYDRSTVARTLALAIEEAGKLHPAAEPLIVHAALLGLEPIPLFLFAEGRVELGEPLASMLADGGLDEAVATLRTFALIEREAIVDERDLAIATDTIRLHRAVREVAAARLEGDALEEVRRALVEALAAVYPRDVDEDPNAWPRARRLDGPALALVGGNAVLPKGVEGPLSDLLDRLALYRYRALGAYASARVLFENALAIREKTLGPEHPDTSAILNNLARLLLARGELAAARPLYERALAIREKVLGPEHPDTAQSLNNLAGLLQAQGDLAAARPLFERALAIYEKMLGSQHPDTAKSLDNLARLLQAQGELAAAQPLFGRALTVRWKVRGPNHPDTALSLDNLARLLVIKGDLTAARPLYESALAIREEAFGPDHPDTALSLNNLAGPVQAQGELEAAQPLCERALAIREKVLGLDHPDTATSLSNLAQLLQAQGELAVARPLYERALAIFDKAADHPDTGASLANLANLLRAQGDLPAARHLYERALAIYEKALGPDHPSTATSLQNLANLLQAQGELTAARPLYERALAIFQKVLGPEHPDTAMVRNDLASLVREAGS